MIPGPIVSYHPLLAADQNLLLVSQRPLGPEDYLAVSRAAAVLLPQACRADLHGLVAGLGRPHFPRPALHLGLDGKVGNHLLFAALGLPQPRGLCFGDLAGALAAWEQGRLARAGLHAPLVAKGAGGGEGGNVFLVGSPEELAQLGPRLETSCAQGPPGLILQELVETGGRDARVVLMGEHHQAFWRVKPPGGFHSNLSRGGRVERHLDPQGLAKARELALRLQARAPLDVAAVDLLVPPGGPALLMEINFYFGRQALGGNQAYGRLYLEAVQTWLAGLDLDPGRVSLDW